ncbi:MAG: Fe-S cluster assembly protein SufD [Candidatus Omnitrophica bacterium]|nr:Fe-S cluster assembly protein SufD [Candidatus Omnitrophota bacterium]
MNRDVLKTPYLNAFESLQGRGNGGNPSWVREAQREAIGRFAKLGFPTTREEAWKYTNVTPIAETSFRLPSLQPQIELSNDQISPFLFGQQNWHRLVFLNGSFVPRLSRAPSGNGVKVCSLKAVFRSESRLIEPYLGQLIGRDADAFAALNTAFLEDGALVYLPEGAMIENPIHLIFISHAEAAGIVSHPRVLIVGAGNSKATVVESYVSRGGGHSFTNAVTEIALGEDAALHYYRLQQKNGNSFHIGTTQVEQNKGSHFLSFSISFGAKISRHNLNVNLAAEGSECTLNGLYLTSGDQHIDNATFVHHPKPHGTSHQLYKGILTGQSTAVFSGRVLVRQDAQKTDAHQVNKNLLLSEQATVDTKPQLEILADDVKCTHGAAVGQLEEEALFYFETRGISREKARKLLAYGFANEVIGTVQLDPIRSALGRLVFERLGDFSCLPEALKHRDQEKDLSDGGL